MGKKKLRLRQNLRLKQKPLKKPKRKLMKLLLLRQQLRRLQMMQLLKRKKWKRPKRKETVVKVDADVAEKGEREDHVSRDVVADAEDQERIVVKDVRVLAAINVLLREEQI